MDPTTAFVMALLALLVALASAATSVWSAVRSARYHPKPQLEIVSQEMPDYDPPAWFVQVTNRGKGEMHDVELNAHLRDDNEPRNMDNQAIVRQGESVSAFVGIDLDRPWRRELYMQLVWRAEPNFRKKRVRTIRPEQ